MNIEINNSSSDRTEIKLDGRLDGVTMSHLEQRLEAECFAQQKKQILFDLTALEYISSAGLRVMLLALKRTAAIKGKVVLYGMQKNVKDIFALSGFNSIFPIVETYEEAIAQF